MSSPNPTPERIDALLTGSEPRDEAEREALALMEGVQNIQDEPSLALQARVKEISATAPEPKGRWFARIPELAGGLMTTPRLAIAGGVAALALVAVVAVPTIIDGSSNQDALSETRVAQELDGRAADDAVASGESEEGAGALFSDEPAPGANAATPPLELAPEAQQRSSVSADAIAPGPDPGRPQEVLVRTFVQVDGVTGLSKASAAAMKQVRELGGFTVSSRYSVPGSEMGVNDLVFKVPSSRVELAVEGFAELGSITSQDASLVDLGAELTASQVQITKRRERVRALREDLAKNPGDATLTAQVESAERQLAQLIERRKKIQERARLATINLTLTTDGPAVVEDEENRFVAAFNRSADRLAVVLEWLISAAVFLLPVGLLGWLGLRLARTGRSRGVRRVMDSV